MSILLCIFAVEKDTIVITPKSMSYDKRVHYLSEKRKRV